MPTDNSDNDNFDEEDYSDVFSGDDEEGGGAPPDPNPIVPSYPRDTDVPPIGDPGPLERLSRDLREAAATLSEQEVRYLVDTYYSLQEYRKASANQGRALASSTEPHEIVDWIQTWMARMELDLKLSLDVWTNHKPLCKWAKSVVGIGPVITAGLKAHVDITKAATAGAIWRLAGLDPSVVWLGKKNSEPFVRRHLKAGHNLVDILTLGAKHIGTRRETVVRYATMTPKGKKQKLTEATVISALAKRPWNGRLKTLCWKIGESFMKCSGRDKDFYGHLWSEHHEKLWETNLSGGYATACTQYLAKKEIKKPIPRMWYTGQVDPRIIQAYRTRGVPLMQGVDTRLFPNITEQGQLHKAPAGLSNRDKAKLKRLMNYMRMAGFKVRTDIPLPVGVPMLPPGHILARSKRWVVKLFLAHYHHAGYVIELGKQPPKPYVLNLEGHTHVIEPPNLGEYE